MKKIKYIAIGKVKQSELEFEDGNNFVAYRISDNTEKDDGIYVKMCSWDETKNHLDFKKFVNKKIKVTIETLD